MLRLNKKQLNEKGITLIEVMVSVMLFGVALGSLMYLMATILTSADDLRNNTVAAGLAQEGLEVVRGIRDEDWINSRPFGSFAEAGPLADGTYEVQWDSHNLTPSTSRNLKKDPVTKLFSYNVGDDTEFKRTIQIITVSYYEKIASVSVTWRSNNGGGKVLKAESHLFDWY